MKHSPLLPSFLAFGLALAPLAFTPAASRAQDWEGIRESAVSRGRAANVARMKAEALNGGLGVYRTARCMHERSGGSCLVRTDASGFLFRFLGGPPGWEQLGLPPTKESEILVSPDGRQVVSVLYNGPPRPAS